MARPQLQILRYSITLYSKLHRRIWSAKDLSNMKPHQFKPLFLLSALITAVVVASACSIIPRNEIRPVANGEDWRVRLVKYSVGSETVTQGGFEHPIEISLAKLNNILSAIYIQDQYVVGKKGRQQLFPANVRRVLLEPLHEAFLKAKPDEVIDFSFLQGKSYLWVFNHDLFTSGIFFKKDGKLHLAMRAVNFQCDNYQEALRQFVSDPTKRALTNDWSFVLRPGMTLKKHEKSGLGLFQKPFFPNWLIIDMSKTYEPVRTRVKHFERIIKAPPAVREKSAPVDFGPPKTGIVKPAVPKSLDDPEVRKRLQVLRELYNSGAISRSTYERKKEELLSP